MTNSHRDPVMEAAGELARALGHTGNLEWPVLKVLKALLDAHAHELAEEIRTEVQTLKDDGVLEPDKDWAAGDAADLIDPEVTT
ncbi:hypothetical protein ACWC0A_37675 [Streptomyces scopuliridis]